MPIYEYQCTVCGHKMEAIQKMSEAPLTDCPACNKSHLQKLVSAAGFQLKGGGWYASDYSGKSQNKEKTGDGEPKASPVEVKTDSSSSSAKTESK